MNRRPVVVVAGEPTTLGHVLSRLGEGADEALREGRVFVGTRRASSTSEPVLPDDQVTMYPAREAGAESPRILLHEGDVVAAYKPADVATVADHHGHAGTLEDEVAALIGVTRDTLVATSRLDVGVSGVVLFALTPDARARLARAREEGRYRRHYVAIATRAPEPPRGAWNAPIGRERDPRKRRAFGVAASRAETAYELRATTERAALLAVEPQTGRTHQIRVHASHAGCPLFGDRAYGGPLRTISDRGSVAAVGRIALHASWIEVPNAHGELRRIEAEIPADLGAIWGACGGDASAWDLAREPIDLG